MELELLSEEEEEESIDSEEIQQLCNVNVEWNEAQEQDAEVAGPSSAPGSTPARISEPREVHTNVNDGIVQEDGTVALIFTMNKEEWQRAVPDCVVGVVDTAEVGAEHRLSKCTEAETRVPTEVEAPNLEVLGTTVAALGTESSMLLFGWAMADQRFTAGADGFYYDPEGVRYCCLGEEGQYTYENVTFVLQGGLDSDRVPSPLADAMVMRVLDYVSIDLPPELRELIEGDMFAGDVGEEVETHSSQAIAQTP
jgi:hypothetical protein